jgi:hypothetical protein
MDRNSRRSGKKPPLEQKNPNRKWPILMCIALGTKILHVTNVSCRLLFDNPVTQDYKGVGGRRPGG